MKKLTLEKIAAQEKQTVLDKMTLSDAQKLGHAIESAAGNKVEDLTITIMLGNRIVYVRAGSNTTYDNDFWARRKRNVVKQHAHSSMYVRLDMDADEEGYYNLTGLNRLDYAIHGGAFPIVVNNVGLVGVISVSGLPMEEDHDICYRGLKIFKEEYK